MLLKIEELNLYSYRLIHNRNAFSLKDVSGNQIVTPLTTVATKNLFNIHVQPKTNCLEIKLSVVLLYRV